jgi:hypothetical protein
MTWMIGIILLLAQQPGSGQRPDSPAVTRPPGAADTARGTVTTSRSTVTSDTASLRGYVIGPDRSAITGAVVTLTRSDSGGTAFARRDTTDASGRYQFDSLAAGPYTVRVAYIGTAPCTVNQEIAGAAVVRNLECAGTCDVSKRLEMVWTITALLLYAVGILWARWNHIARSIHEVILRQLMTLRTRLLTEVHKRNFEEETRANALLDAVDKLLKEVNDYRQQPKLTKIFEYFFWSRGKENATWIGIHEIERQLAACIAPNEQVNVSLQWAEAELRLIGKPVCISIADAIHAALDPSTAGAIGDEAAQDNRRRALLGRALAMINGERDTSFFTLMEWQNKAGWLMLAAMIIISFLALAAGKPVLFLAGAAGGFVSRLMRALRREDIPLDYGASWATLFLSPMFGAFAGWFGVALIELGTDSSVNLLGDAFKLISWDNPCAAATLAAAFLLGFSERFFDSVVGAVERHVDRTVSGGPSTPGSTSTSRPPIVPGQTGMGLGAGKPVITAITWQSVANGAAKEALLVRGTGFDPKAKAVVNGTSRAIEYQSSDTLLILLIAEDVDRIENGGETTVIITNPDGTASGATSIDEDKP